ncbi:MAG: hypothetical protein HY789_09520, partial [Deltaproteobacteria bacterium]|nr:hypothetical protein [Deltaproteobacteria bacterium]
MLLLILACPPAAAEERVVTVGGVQLDINVLKNALEEQVREELSEAIKDGREQLGSLPGDAAAQTRQFLYDEFKRWVRVRIYQELPEPQRQKLASQEILPDDPRFDPYLERRLQEKPDEAGMLARAYLLESSGRNILTDLQEGASKEIIDGLNDLYGDATEKLQRFTRAVEEAEEAETPSTDILEKHGFSSPWMEKFKGREAQYRKLQGFNKKYNVVDSLQLLTEAFQAEMPRQRIGAMFGLLEKLGGAAGESRIPIVSFMGQMVENLAKAAAELLAAEERLGAIIRAREGNCLGADTHDLDTPLQKKFHSQFDAAIRICPTDLSPDIYVQDEPSDSSRLYFFLNGRFVTGNPEGGGIDGLHQVSRLLEEAAAANFVQYAGKAADPATLAAVYNTPYPPPGDEKFDEKQKQNGTGIPGVMNEAVAVLDGISGRLTAMEKLVSGEEACGEEKLHAFLKSATGLNAREYHDAEARLAHDLRLHYVMAYIDRYMAAASETGGVRRTTAYDTYSRIWEKFEKLSLLRVSGRVTADGESACRDCAAATVAGRVAGGGPQVLPVCTAGKVDQYGAFSAF